MAHSSSYVPVLSWKRLVVIQLAMSSMHPEIRPSRPSRALISDRCSCHVCVQVQRQLAVLLNQGDKFNDVEHE